MADIRPATADDIDDLVRLGQALHAESPRYSRRRFDPQKVRDLTAQVLQMDTAAIFVATSLGQVIGLFVIVATSDWFGPDLHATDLVVYVDPAHRGGTAFPKLVRAVEEWARAKGVLDLDIGVSTGIHTMRTVCVYERLGYTLGETRVVSKTMSHGD